MTEKEARPDQPDIALLPTYPALGQVRRIGTEKVSINVGTGHQVRRHRAHPTPILGCQWRGTYHNGGP